MTALVIAEHDNAHIRPSTLNAPLSAFSGKAKAATTTRAAATSASLGVNTRLQISICLG